MKVKNKLKKISWKAIGNLSQVFKIARGAINQVLIKMGFDKAETIKRSENFIHLLKAEIAEYQEHIEGYQELVNKLKTSNAELEKQYNEALAHIAKEKGDDFVLITFSNKTDKEPVSKIKSSQGTKSEPTIIKPLKTKKIPTIGVEQGHQYQNILTEIDNIDEGYETDNDHER